MKILLLVWILIASVSPSQAGCALESTGWQKCGPGDCVQLWSGYVKCSAYVGGGISIDSNNWAYCGRGECASESTGYIKCSPIANGGAITLGTGYVQCTDNAGKEVECEDGSTDRCVDGVSP